MFKSKLFITNLIPIKKHLFIYNNYTQCLDAYMYWLLLDIIEILGLNNEIDLKAT